MSFNTETLKIYLRESWHFKKLLIASVVLVPLSATLIGVVVPFFLAHIIDLLSQGKHLGDPAFMRAFYSAMGMSAVAIVINRFGYTLLLKLDYKVRARLQQLAFDALVYKSYSFYANHKVGALTSHYIGFVGAYGRINQIFINEGLNISIALLVGIILIFTQSVLLGSALLLVTVVIFIVSYVGVKKRTPYRNQRKKLVAELHGTIADNIGNNMAIKMFSQEKTETLSVASKVSAISKVFAKDYGYFASESNIRHSIMLTFQLGIIILATWLLQEGAISLGVVVFSLTYLIRLSNNLFAIGSIINGYEQAMTEASPMTEVLLSAADVQDKKDAKELQVANGDITFKNVTFSYEDGTDTVFKNLQLHIKAGEKIGLVGASGGGKTTITKLLLRFLDIQKGTIEIDGQAISDVTQESLRRAISYVPQEPLLFHRSLRENIAYGKPNATEKEIIAAAKKAHAHEFITKLTAGYDTIVGERGVKLSGGQKQRVAIARAILANAPILVLDEATSALDSESEKLIQTSLKELMQGRTSIVIAHRLSTIQQLDRIIVLDNGRIIEEGTHTSLIKKKGKYAQLWQHQSGGFLEE